MIVNGSLPATGQCAPKQFFHTVLLPIIQKIKLVISVVFLTPLFQPSVSFFVFVPSFRFHTLTSVLFDEKQPQVVEPDAVLLNLKFLTARLWHIPGRVCEVACGHCAVQSPSIGCGGAVIAPSADVRMRRFVAFARGLRGCGGAVIAPSGFCECVAVSHSRAGSLVRAHWCALLHAAAARLHYRSCVGHCQHAFQAD